MVKDSLPSQILAAALPLDAVVLLVTASDCMHVPDAVPKVSGFYSREVTGPYMCSSAPLSGGIGKLTGNELLCTH